MGSLLRFFGEMRRAGSMGRRLLLLEAVFSLAVARFVVRRVPFARLEKWLSHHVGGLELDDPARRVVRRDVRWSVHRASGYFRVPAVCFPQALAAQGMLRRRRVGTCLYYGLAVVPGKGLAAHVWLQDGETAVVGHRQSTGYHVLARYSSSRMAPGADSNKSPQQS
jgi:hypothetical protein